MMFIVLFESFMYFLCIYVILKNVYGIVPIYSKKIIFLIMLVPLVALLTTLNKNFLDFVQIFLCVISMFLLANIFNSAKVRSILSIYILLYSINISLSSLIVFTIDISGNSFAKGLISIVTNVIITVFCLIIIILKQSYIYQQFKLIPKNVKRITILSIVSSSFVISLISDFETFINIDKWTTVMRISFVLLIIFIGSAFPILIANSIGKNFYINQSKNFETQIQGQAEYYENLSKSNYELRRFKHDYKNMQIGVSKLIESKDFEGALKMLKDSDASINSAVKNFIKFDTGDGIVDALLTEKQKKATTINTVITFNGAIPFKKISPTDLCILFGNTIDNAIEACTKIPNEIEKTISIDCNCKGGFMFLTIVNPVNETIIIHNNKIKTSKQDKLNHGFGLYSIDITVKKYKGDLSLSCENNTFSTSIEIEI